MALELLLSRIVESGLLEDPVSENGLVYGRASLDAAGTVVNVNVDPELDGDESAEDMDPDELVAAIARVLSMSEKRWRAIVEEVALDIEDAVDEEPVVEQVDLRDDLEATSVVVFADAVLLAFVAPGSSRSRASSCSSMRSWRSTASRCASPTAPRSSTSTRSTS